MAKTVGSLFVEMLRAIRHGGTPGTEMVHGILRAFNEAGLVGLGSLAYMNIGDVVATTLFGSGTVPTARLGSGSASATTFLRGDQSWAVAGVNAKVLNITFTAAAGSQAFTGSGFTPKALVCFARASNTTVSVGLATGTTARGVIYRNSAGVWGTLTTKFMNCDDGASSLSADLTSFDSDGFTADKAGSPAIAVDAAVLALG